MIQFISGMKCRIAEKTYTVHIMEKEKFIRCDEDMNERIELDAETAKSLKNRVFYVELY